MADRGQITGALLDGPLALDNAISPDAAAIKHIVSPVAGKANVLIVPDLEAGNMLAKSLSFLAGADAAGIVLGARVPIILTSRADSLLTRLASCAVAVLVAAARRASAGHRHCLRKRMNDTIRPVLAGHKALVVGIANDQSIAYGCAKAFRERRRRARHHLAERKGPPATSSRSPASSRRRSPVRSTSPCRDSSRRCSTRSRTPLGQARHPRPFDRLRAAR